MPSTPDTCVKFEAPCSPEDARALLPIVREYVRPPCEGMLMAAHVLLAGGPINVAIASFLAVAFEDLHGHPPNAAHRDCIGRNLSEMDEITACMAIQAHEGPMMSMALYGYLLWKAGGEDSSCD